MHKAVKGLTTICSYNILCKYHNCFSAGLNSIRNIRYDSYSSQKVSIMQAEHESVLGLQVRAERVLHHHNIPHQFDVMVTETTGYTLLP